jgi:hypothetical protein
MVFQHISAHGFGKTEIFEDSSLVRHNIDGVVEKQDGMF